jgi:hypothetical protein
MRKVLIETERASNGLLEAISAVKEKQVRVDVSEFTLLLRRLQHLYEAAVNEQG